MCLGDEKFWYDPAAPKQGDSATIVVSSARAYGNVGLSGTAPVTFAKVAFVGSGWASRNTPLRSYNAVFSVTFGAVIGLALVGYLLASWASGRISGLGLTASLGAFGYAYVPLALAAHLGHNFSHVLLEGPAALQVILSQAGLIALPQAAVEAAPGYGSVTVLAVAVLLLGIAGAFYVMRKLARRYAPARRAAWSQYALLTAFSVAYLVMFLLPMNPRHRH